MSFQDYNKHFFHDVIPDTGSSRTIFAKNVLDSHNIKFDPNINGEELYNASKTAMVVNGTVNLTTNYNGRNQLIEGLVSEDIEDTILLSWHDAEKLGSITINRKVDTSTDDLESRITKLKKKFSACLKDTLSEKPMDGPPMRINLKKNVKIFPKKIYTAPQIPLHLKPAADKVLADAIANKLIEPVPPSEPSDWCSRGFFVPKPNGGARMVVDLSPLNEVIERPIHPFTDGTNLIKNLDPQSKYFAKLDAVLGYYQIPLDEESKKLTTFLLSSGRYRYLRAPMGCSASSDEWCARSDAALAGIKGCHKLVDDILIEGKTYDELFSRLDTVLQKCLNHNITISLKKMQIGDCVTFGGYQVSANGILPVPDRTKAITDFPAPKNTKELKKHHQFSPLLFAIGL